MSQNQGSLGATIVNKLIAIRIEALEPYPLTMKGGVLPTALKARTGNPGRSRWASKKSSWEPFRFIGGFLFILQPLSEFLGMIGKDNVSPGSLDGG